MELNQGQKKAKELAIQWFRRDTKEKQVFYITGAAGTGKTSLVMSIIEELHLDVTEVAFLAYTGKASLVLRRKGIPATTIHHLIYEVTESVDENGERKIIFSRKHRSALKNIKLIVVDECSMIGEKLWKDLIYFEIPILLLGDINQLPPVQDSSAVSSFIPDAILTDIVRQEADNPLIKLSQSVIAGKLYLPKGNYDDKVVIVDSNQVTDDLIQKADIVICGKNQTRDNLNAYIRREILHIESDIPVNMEKLICRKNSWSINIQGGKYCLTNGMIGYCSNIYRPNSYATQMYCNFSPDFLIETVNDRASKIRKEETLEEIYSYDNETSFNNLLVDLKPFKAQTYKERQKLIQGFTAMNGGEKFEYGYAITAHLSQGSEWNKVLCFFERMGDSEFMQKWLYTAITRSSDRLILAY